MDPPPPPPPPPPPAAPFLPSQPPNPPPPPPPQPTSLTTALSDLKSLLDLCATTLHSLPTPNSTATSRAAVTFVPCPFNPNHRLPPSSLFSHYLNCPSPLSLPHTFHYPLTLRSSSSPTTSNPPPTLPADSSNLTISLENYIGYITPTNSFFYQNCPGPVTTSIQPPPSLNLPRVLYIDCAEFNKDASPKGFMGFSVDFIIFLPSEILVIPSEIDGWGGRFPAFYSLRVLRAILRLRDDKLLHLYEWIIANSPRYGVIIDSPMTDHMVVLVKLCLKVIVKEAFELAGIIDSNGEVIKTENVFSGLSNRSFECPVLVEVMMWLALQFSILFGEVNSKFFAVEVLRECISVSALSAPFFPLEGKDAELSDREGDVETDDAKRDKREDIKGETVGNSMIFISDVAAAVAALHERSLIEEKIKAIRNSESLSVYQRYMEHEHLSKLADEERQQRPDYRPIIEHDGSLQQRSSNQEVNKVKTREELLAEERDYKRRRMSYRGKKVKRNTLEVMRDIIEEHMEEIREAGGIGSTSKSLGETEASASENLDKHESATDIFGLRRNLETTEENRGHSVDYRKYRKDLHSRHYSGDFKDDNQRPIQDSTCDHGRQYPSIDVEGARYDKGDHSGSRNGREINSHASEHMHVRETQDSVDAYAEDYSRSSQQRRIKSRDGKYYERSGDEHERRTHKRGDEHERTSRKRGRDEDNWEHGNRGRSKTDSASRERDEDKGGHADTRKGKENRNSSSRRELHEFDDRYDPAESDDFL